MTKLRESEQYLQVNRAVFERAGQAIMAKIMENKDAAEALKVTSNPRVAAAAAQVPKGLGQAGGGVAFTVLPGERGSCGEGDASRSPLLYLYRRFRMSLAGEMRE